MNTTDGTIFKRAVKGSNFLTPDVLGYYTVRDYEVELSGGSGFKNENIYGVTVVNRVTGKHDHAKSQMFYDKSQALDYIKELGKDWRE